MAEFFSDKIKNIALIGHGGEGKTTLAEAILYNCKAIDRQGKVDDGNTVMDFDAEEKAKGISISLAVANCVYNGTKLNILDAPGFFDFEGEMVQALTVAGIAVVVTSASGSLTVGTEKAIDYCIKNNIPCMLFINGMDKENIYFYDTLDAIRAKYSTKVIPLMLPILEDNKAVGYANILEGRAFRYSDEKTACSIPSDVQKRIDEVRGSIVEAAAESDEELMEKYFENGDLDTPDVIKGISKGVKNGSSIPVFFGSAHANRGINNFIEMLSNYAPSASMEPAVKAVNAKDEPIEIKISDEGGTVVRIFKTIADPFIGRLSIFKIIRGTLKSGITLYNSCKEADEKISGISTLMGVKQTTADTLHAGDIGAIVRLQNTSTGDTLCTQGNTVILAPIVLPRPVLSMAVYAAKKGDEDKIFGGLNKLQDEDISYSVTKNIETGEMLLNGVGETQLDMLCRKLKNKYGVEAVLKDPRIPYRETIKKQVEAEGKHKKQSGGAGQYGHCKVRFSPNFESDFEFVDEVVGGSVPRQFIPAVEKGLRLAVLEGVLAGYPMVNIRCALFDGSSHPVDSKEIAFVSAAKIAYQEGCVKANPVILEPIYTVKVTVPDSFMGDILGDMNKRRGRILGMEMVGDKQVISAEAPLSEITKYATDLRSMTQGRGSYELEFNRYEEVPSTNTAKIIEEAKRLAEEKKEG